jgi:hypothetical protein
VTRARTMRDDGRRPTASRWVDLGGRGKFKTWQLAGTRYFVRHGGHPTANYPWYGERPDGSIITSGKDGQLGMAFRYLDDAKVAVELEHAGQYGAIALTAAHRTGATAKPTVLASRRRVTRSRRSRRERPHPISRGARRGSTAVHGSNTPSRTELHHA